jgi:general secretion pathway protein G
MGRHPQAPPVGPYEIDGRPAPEPVRQWSAPVGGGAAPRRGGFTVIEVLVVIALIMAIIAIGGPMYGRARDKAMVVRAIAEISTIQKDIAIYTVDHQSLPARLDDVGTTAIRDPWGNPYQYLSFVGLKGKGKMRKDRFLVPLNSDYDLYSMGKDGQSTQPLTAKQSRDDIIRANNGAFIGLAADF